MQIVFGDDNVFLANRTLDRENLRSIHLLNYSVVSFSKRRARNIWGPRVSAYVTKINRGTNPP